jgi:hypothetical protein
MANRSNSSALLRHKTYRINDGPGVMFPLASVKRWRNTARMRCPVLLTVLIEGLTLIGERVTISADFQFRRRKA